MNRDALGTSKDSPLFYLCSFKNSSAHLSNTDGHVPWARHRSHCDEDCLMTWEGLFFWGVGEQAHRWHDDSKLHRSCAGEPRKEDFRRRTDRGWALEDSRPPCRSTARAPRQWAQRVQKGLQGSSPGQGP